MVGKLAFESAFRKLYKDWKNNITSYIAVSDWFLYSESVVGFYGDRLSVLDVGNYVKYNICEINRIRDYGINGLDANNNDWIYFKSLEEVKRYYKEVL